MTVVAALKILRQDKKFTRPLSETTAPPTGKDKKNKIALCAGQHRKQMPTALNLNEHTLDWAERE